MNERIKELESQCWEPRQYGPAWFNSTKFSELIVKECADIIQKEVSMKYKDGAGETEEFMGGHYAASVLARVKIKQHFGIAE